MAFLPKPKEEYKAGDAVEGLIVTVVDTARDQLEVNTPEAMVEQAKMREEGGGMQSLSSLPVGTPVEGEVKRVTPFGIFLDIGAERDALYPANQVSKDLKEYKPGDKITGIRITMNDPVQMRLAVSDKKSAADFQEGEDVAGEVTKIMTFGVFVDIGASTEALAPASLLAKPPAEYAVGDKLEDLKITQLDILENKISVAQAGAGDGEDGQITIDSLQVGQKVKGIIRVIQDYGIFMDIGLFRRDALLPMSLLGTMKREDFLPNTEVEAYVSGVDRAEKRVTLSMTEPSSMQAASSNFVSEGIPPTDMLPSYPFWHIDMKDAFWHGCPATDEDPNIDVNLLWMDHHFPGMVKWPEKELAFVNGFKGKHAHAWQQTLRAPLHYIPVPFHLRKPDAEVPEMEVEANPLQWDSGIKPEIHDKFRFMPCNNPNYVHNKPRELVKPRPVD